MVRVKTAALLLVTTAVVGLTMTWYEISSGSAGGGSALRARSSARSPRAAAVPGSEPGCLNVEAPTPSGDNTCFPHDALGMACGWDKTPKEAYCTQDTQGNKVCARKLGGGKGSISSCNNCGKMGHATVDCYYIDGDCWNCGKHDHKAAQYRAPKVYSGQQRAKGRSAPEGPCNSGRRHG